MAKIVGSDTQDAGLTEEKAWEKVQDDAFIEDLQNRETIEAPESRQRAEEQREAPKEPETPKYDQKAPNKRQAIADKLKADRDAIDRNPQRVAITDEAERLQVGPNVKTRMDRLHDAEDKPEVKAPAQVQTAADIPPVVKRQIKVNGQIIEVDEDQLVGLAQRAAASDSILEEAKLKNAQANQRLAEIERLQADHSRTRPTEAEPQQSQAEDTKPATDDELDTIIEQIQFGDKSDAAKALRTYGDQLVSRARELANNSDERVTQLVAQTLDNERVRGETQRALDSFMSENTDFASSEKRQGVLVDETLSVMEANLNAYNVTKEMIDKYAEANGLPHSVAVSAAYRRLRTDGHPLPDQSAVLKTAASNVRREFGMPDPAQQRQEPVRRQAPDNSNFVAERQERKQAIVQQPRRATLSPADQPIQQPMTEDRINDSRRAAIAKMRAVRRGR